MWSYFRRCQACGSEFSYSSRHLLDYGRFYGDYCPECSLKLKNVLESISVRFEPRWKETDEIEKVCSIIRQVENETKDELHITPLEFVPDGMQSGKVAVCKGKKYCLCEDEAGKQHAFVWWAFDLEKNCFDGKQWLIHDEDNDVYRMEKGLGAVHYENVEGHEIDKPVGKLMFAYFKGEV